MPVRRPEAGWATNLKASEVRVALAVIVTVQLEISSGIASISSWKTAWKESVGGIETTWRSIYLHQAASSLELLVLVSYCLQLEVPANLPLKFDRCRQTRNHKRHDSQRQNYIAFNQNQYFLQIVEKGSMVSSPTSHIMLSRMRFRHLVSSLIVIRVVYHYREFFHEYYHRNLI